MYTNNIMVKKTNTEVSNLLVQIERMRSNIQRLVQVRNNLTDQYTQLERQNARLETEYARTRVMTLLTQSDNIERAMEDLYEQISHLDESIIRERRNFVSLQNAYRDAVARMNEEDDRILRGGRIQIYSVSFPIDTHYDTSIKRLKFIRDELGVDPIKKQHKTTKFYKYRILEPDKTKVYRTKILKNNVRILFGL